MNFNIPLNKVELSNIEDYRLMLFTVFNNSVLQSGKGEFSYMTEDEEVNEFDSQIEYYKNKGFFNG